MAEKMTDVDESMSLEPEEDIGESISLKPEEDMDESMSLKPKEIPNKPRFDFSDEIVGEDASFNDAQQEVTGAPKKAARIQWPWPK